MAAPIARKALDYYLLGKRPGEKDRDTTKVPKEDVDEVRTLEEITDEQAAPAPARQ